ncbi:MAG TPA: flagellar biosynthesis protein FlhB [Patescibacteria group bacterium]|nr:flagellar biosynthesis protein FlhB [Patescibacteria group bacterium]
MNHFDLQLFSSEKTEEPTAKKKEDSRKKGQVAKSVEISAVFVLFAAFAALKVSGPTIYEELSRYMTYSFSHLLSGDFTIQFIYTQVLVFTIIFMKVMLPVLLAVVVASLAANYMQVGFIFSPDVLMPDFSKMNPINGLQRMFSLRSLAELFKSMYKVVLVSYFVYRFGVSETMQIPKLVNAELIDSLRLTGAMVIDLAFQIIAVLLVLAVLDYSYQWWQNNEDMKMSKDEVKEEYKQTEGHPEIKRKIKERQRALAMQRMMQEIPKADVVVTNPTHFAVALRYDKEMSAPVVVAKGQDYVALRIKEQAKKHQITIVENKSLARTLYATVEVGSVIPVELYQAVAEVLAYVYRLKKRLS